MEPLVVRAVTPDGFAASDPWSPALDAILAHQVVYGRLGGERFALASAHTAEMAPVEGLPLEVERDGAWWWYQASSPIYEARAVERPHYHRRFDADLAARFGPSALGRVPTSAGPYKSSRLTVLERKCPSVTWHTIGDEREIRRLLARVTAVGAKVGSGYGRVARWTVETGGDPDLARFHRPLPVEFAARVGRGGDCMDWGIRPPGRLPANQTLCVMP